LYLKSYTGPLVARDNVVFNQYGYGIHAYSNANSGKLVNIRLQGNVAFNNGSPSRDHANPNILLGGAAVATGDAVEDNLTYFPPGARSANMRIGFQTVLNGDVQVRGNYLAGGDPVLDFGYWQAAIVANNILVGTGTSIRRHQSSTSHIFRDNTEQRRARDTKVVVQANPYERGRAHIVVYNWGNGPEVSVDLSEILHTGDQYEIHRVDDLFGPPVKQGVASGGPTTVPVSREFEVFLVRTVNR
jgi:hypothetical protein